MEKNLPPPKIKENQKLSNPPFLMFLMLFYKKLLMANCFDNILGFLTNRILKKEVWPTEVRLLSFGQVKLLSCLSEQAEFGKGIEKTWFYGTFWAKMCQIMTFLLKRYRYNNQFCFLFKLQTWLSPSIFQYFYISILLVF